MKKKNPYLNDRDILDNALEHSWGKSADAKAKERAYNREYYQRHKEEILRKARQAGEGIQRTAQNAYNTARREAQGIRDAVNPQPRRFSNPKGWTRSENEAFNKVDNYGAEQRELNEARKYRNLAKNTPGAAETERRYRDAMRARSQNAAAVNEALKDGRQLAPDSRFDSKLVRDAQNAYSKVRGKGREAKREIDSTMTKARSNIENAYDTVRREAQGIRDSVTNPPRRSANPTAKADNTGGWHSTGTGIVYNSNDFRKTAKDYKNWAANAKRERDHHIDKYKEAVSGGYRELANEYLGKLRKEHTDYKDALAISKSAANKYANEAKAKNEAAKAKSQRAPESKYDSKLVRDAQNAYSKVRRTGRESKQALDNAMNTAKSTLTKAQKEALRKREGAKRRMQKWFKR